MNNQKLIDLVQEAINYLQEHGHYPEAADLEYSLLKLLEVIEE